MIRGDVFWVDLIPRSGSEQTGRRPAVIVSRDSFNALEGWRSMIVVPLTTARSRTHRGPTAVPIPAGSSGLLKDSIALCHQVTTLDRGKLSKRITTLSPAAMRAIDDGLRAALSLD